MAVTLCRVLIGAVSLLSFICALREGVFHGHQQLRNRAILGETDAAAAQTFSDVTRATGCAWRCMTRSNCSYFFHSSTSSTCSLCSSLRCRNITMKEAPGYRLFLKDEASPSSNDTNLCPNAQKPMGCWKEVSSDTAGKRVVSVGPAGLWGLQKTSSGADGIYYMTGTNGNPRATGPNWSNVPGHLIQLDVGSNVMIGVNNVGSMWKRTGFSSTSASGSNWVSPASGYTWVTVSPDTANVWAVNAAGQLRHARDTAASLASQTTWNVTATGMRRVDAGRAGVWALDAAGRLYCRLGTYGDPGGSGTEWVSVSNDTFASVSSGTHMVVVVTDAGRIWFRTGLGVHTPAGLTWVRYAGEMEQVDVYETGNVTALWGLSDSGRTLYFSLLEI